MFGIKISIYLFLNTFIFYKANAFNLYVIFRNDSQISYLENHNNGFNSTIPVVIKIAVASLGNFYAKPFGPELRVKPML